jgi:hypothetical protein
MELSEIKIDVDVDTNNFATKLRAIARHAQALADELDQIDYENKINNLK